MATKRLSTEEPMYPPKKRALYEHKRQSELLKCDTVHTDQITEENFAKNDFLQLKMKLECSQSDMFCMRPRCDSAHSIHSIISDPSETGSTSREPSPDMGLFDSRTPERNPVNSFKRDISKPLFPVGNEKASSSIVENESRSLESSFKTQNDISYGKETDTHHGGDDDADSQLVNSDKSFSVDSKVVARQDKSEDSTEIYQNYPHLSREVRTPSEHSLSTGPMVSLMSRFDKEAVTAYLNPNLPNQSTQMFKEIVNNNGQDLNNAPRKSNTSPFSEKDGMFLFGTKTYKCRICNKSFEGHELLKAHMKDIHSGPLPYKCEHCPRAFSQYNNLQRHLRVHRAKIYKCKLCDREFNEEFYLTMHMGTHTGKRVYSCGVCSASFTSNQDLKLHVKTHSPSQLHTCEVCGKSFSKACVLRQHRKGHSGERPHKCEKCPKTFIHRHHLTMHMKSHGEEKQYSCDICKKEFYQSSHLYKHLKVHEEEGRISKEAIDNMGLDANKTAVDKISNTEKKAGHSHKGEKAGKSVKDISAAVHHSLTPKMTQRLPSMSEAFVLNDHGSLSSTSHQTPRQGLPVPPTLPYNPHSLMTNMLHHHSAGSIGYTNWYPAYSPQLQAHYNSIYQMNYQSKMMLDQSGLYDRSHSAHQLQQNTTDKSLYLQDGGTKTIDTSLAHFAVKEVPEKHDNDNSARKEVAAELIKMSEGLPKGGGNHIDNNKDTNTHVTEGGQRESTVDDSYKFNEGKNISFSRTVQEMVCKSTQKSFMSDEDSKMLSSKSVMVPKSCDARLESVPSHSAYPFISKHSPLPSSMVKSWTDQSMRSPVSFGHSYIHREANHREPNATHSQPYTLNSNLYLMNRYGYPGNQGYYPYIPRQQQPHLKPFMMSPTFLPSFVRNPSETKQVSPNSPKKRHYSSQDIYIIKKPVAKETGQLANRQRHLSASPQSHALGQEQVNNSVAIESNESLPWQQNRLLETTCTTDNTVDTKIKTCHPVEEKTFDNNTRAENESPTLANEENHSEFGNDRTAVGQTNKEMLRDASYHNKIELTDHHSKEHSEQIYQEGVKVDNFLNDSLGEKKLEIDLDVVEDSDTDKIGVNEMNSTEKDCEGSLRCDEEVKNSNKKHDQDTSFNGDITSKSKDESSEIKPMNDIPEVCDSTGALDLSLKEHEVSVHCERDTVSVNMEINKENITTVRIDTDIMDLSIGKLKVVKATGEKADMTVRHNLTMNSDLNNVCGICWKRFENSLEFENHQIEHAQKLETSSKCRICDKVFARPFDLQCHILKHREYSNNGKTDSGLQFGNNGINTKRYGAGNQTESTKENQSTESQSGIQCEKSSNQSTILGEYSLQVDVKQYLCEICMRVFTHKHNLTRHKMSHNEKCYECSICKRTFKERFYLQMHMKTHAEEKTRQCEICSAHVPKSELWEHTNEHLGNIVGNPTYKQIGCRVDEILKGKSVEQNMTLDSPRRKVLGEKKINLIQPIDNGPGCYGKKTELKDSYNENTPDLAFNYLSKENLKLKTNVMKDIFKPKNGATKLVIS